MKASASGSIGGRAGVVVAGTDVPLHWPDWADAPPTRAMKSAMIWRSSLVMASPADETRQHMGRRAWEVHSLAALKARWRNVSGSVPRCAQQKPILFSPTGLVAGAVFGVRGIEARQLGPGFHLLHDPALQRLLFRSLRGNFL